MYCSKNIINRALNKKDYCDDDFIEETIDCISCTCYCIDKGQLREKVFLLLHDRTDITNKDISIINKFIKNL